MMSSEGAPRAKEIVLVMVAKGTGPIACRAPRLPAAWTRQDARRQARRRTDSLATKGGSRAAAARSGAAEDGPRAAAESAPLADLPWRAGGPRGRRDPALRSRSAAPPQPRAAAPAAAGRSAPPAGRRMAPRAERRALPHARAPSPAAHRPKAPGRALG